MTKCGVQRLSDQELLALREILRKPSPTPNQVAWQRPRYDQPTARKLRSWQRIVDLGGPPAILKTPEEELAALLKDAGLSCQKARWIKRSLEMVVERFGRLSLDDTAAWADEEVERFLTTLPGIALKSARCVMMYSMGRQVLPVDTHLRRLAERLGWVAEGRTERRIHSELEVLVERGLRYSLHVNAIWHGREVCRALRPRCEECVLREGCQRSVNGA